MPTDPRLVDMSDSTQQTAGERFSGELELLSVGLASVASELYAGGPAVTIVPGAKFSASAGPFSVVDADATADGRFLLPASIGGRVVGMLVDTGASVSALPAALAATMPGLVSLRTRPLQTASDVLQAARVGADSMVLANRFTVSRIAFAVLPGGGNHPILGMDILRQLRYSFDGGRLWLQGLARAPG